MRRRVSPAEWLVLVLLALFMWLGGGRFAGAADVGGLPVAFVLAGGNGPPNEFPATVRWPNYAEMAIAIGPQLRAAGIKRLFLHNPGGDHWKGWLPNPATALGANAATAPERLAAIAAGVDVREMWVDQWQLAESSRCRFADREALKLGHRILQFYGVEEVIYYVGSPETLRDAAKEGPACVEMYLACGEGASVAFDASCWTTSRWQPGDDVSKFYRWLRTIGAKIYIEPRLTKEQVAAGLGQLVDGTIAADDFDTGPHFKPDLAIQPGETIRGPLAGFGTAKPPAGVTAMWRDPKDLNWTRPK